MQSKSRPLVRQRCNLGNVLGREVAACLGIERLADILIGGSELSMDAEQGHQVLRTAPREFEYVGLVVTDMVKQFVPDRPLVIEPPAPQGLEDDLPAVSQMFLGHQSRGSASFSPEQMTP